jgi:hypothetical protein
MGGIVVVGCKFWNVGGLVQVCGLWLVEEFQNLVPEVFVWGVGSGIQLFLKVSVFEFLNPCGLVPAKVVPGNEIWREVFFKSLAVPTRKCSRKILPPK